MFKINYCEKQKSNTYITYMMVGSYFHKAVFFNKRLEERLFLHFREMPFSRQLKTEDIILQKMNKLNQKELKQFESMNCIVSLSKKGEDYELIFDTDGFGFIKAVIGENGKINLSITPWSETELSAS